MSLSFESALLPTILEIAPGPVVILDRDARIRLFNKAAEVATGYAKADVLGQPFWKLLDPDDEDRIRELFTELRVGKRDTLEGLELGWVSRTSGKKHLVCTASAFRDERDRFGFVVCAGLDLTELRALKEREQATAAEQAAIEARQEVLRGSEARLSGIVELASDAIISIDEDHRITLFNQGAQAIFGWTPDEVLGQPLNRLLPKRAREVHSDHVRAFAASSVKARQMGERQEISGLRKNGEEFPAEASIIKLNVDGERVYTVVLRDVSAQRRRERQQAFLVEVGKVLATSLELDTTLSAIADAAVGFLADYSVVDLIEQDGSVRRIRVSARDGANREAARILSEVTLDRSRPHLMYPAIETGRSQLVRSVSDTHLREIAQNVEHLAGLQAMDMASYMVVPLLAGDRMLGALLLAAARGRQAYDEQDLELAEEVGHRAALAVENARLYRDARRAIQARDDILGVVSHDLGNPLQAIFIGLEALKRSGVEADPEEQKEARGKEYYVSAIRRSAERMQRLIHELLEVRRMEEGHLTLEPVRQPLGPLVDEALDLIEPLARVKSVELDNALDDSSLPTVDVDRDRLLQVLSNLVGNAVKHTPEGGRVRVSASAAAGELQVSVSDTGPGIPPEHRQQIFDRFWRAEKTGGKGIGLGLAIAKGIVRSHGGRIWVESEEGRGSTFHFTLPLPSSLRGTP